MKDFTHCGDQKLPSATGQLSSDTILEGRYIIVNILGKGGMGAVYKALDQRLNNTPVAIKEMSTGAVGVGNLQAAIDAFKREATMLISLRHPSLPRVTDFFAQGENRWYLVMDYIEGETLNEVIKRRGFLPEHEVQQLAVQLCEILDYLHNQNPPVIFRDLKPSNIILTPDNQIKLIDFGIARHFRPGLTSDTIAYGSYGFAAPEQYGHSQTDARSDIYSLGAVLYYLLTGIDPSKNPFLFNPPSEKVVVSPAFESAIMKALEFKPNDRHNNVREMLAHIKGKNHVNNLIETQALNDPELTKTLNIDQLFHEAGTEALTVQTRVASKKELKGPNELKKTKELYNNKELNQATTKVLTRKNIPKWTGLFITALIGMVLLFVGIHLGPNFFSGENKGGSLVDELENSNKKDIPVASENKEESNGDNEEFKSESEVSDKVKISQAVNSWAKTFREKELHKHMEWYADYLEIYYLTPNFSKDSVYKDKAQLMKNFDVIDVSISDIRIDFENSSTAKVTFNKKWDAKGKETFSGEEIQRLRFCKFNDKWLITGEEEIQIYWAVKNGKKIA